jgi:serine phosphatase RsbU (regulator of sigma subunit)
MAILSKGVVDEEIQYLQDTQMIGALLGGTMHVIYVILFAFCEVDLLLWFNIVISLPVFTIAFILSYTGRLKYPPLIGTIEVTIHQFSAVLILGQDTGFHILLFCLVPIGMLFRRWKISFFVNSLIALILFLTVLWFDSGQFIIYELPENTLRVIRTINSVGLFTIVGVIIFYYISLNKSLYRKQKVTYEKLYQANKDLNATVELVNQQKNKIESQHKILLEQNRHITNSIHYAERIQTAILPPKNYLSGYLTDHFILFKPRDIVSGDFFWAMHQNGKIVTAVADCTGHGVPGAFLSILGISYLNEILISSESIHPNEILGKLREYVIQALHQTGEKGETQDGIEIALCVIDIHKKKLEFSGANRPIYIIRNKTTDASLLYKKDRGSIRVEERNSKYHLIHVIADEMPIGIYDQESTVPFTNREVQLKKNDSIYLFSDGYVDQIGGPRRKTFRTKYFKQLLIDIQDNPMSIQKELLLERMEEWQGDVEQIDDILVVGIKMT